LVGSRGFMSAENTSVLVLLVASNAESWLPDVIEGVRNQTHDELEVLVVDNASTDRSRAMLEKAFGPKNVVSLDRRVGYGRALAAGLKVAAERGSDAQAFLLLHDDAAMDPRSVEAMVAALSRERVGIVGAKLVDWNEPEKLLEVGLTTDRFGRNYNPLEVGELDQGQHDGLKEVFYSSSACLLVGREVVERVGLFDLRFALLRDDFDLCWRARIAGWRSVVTTDARVRHAAVTASGERAGPAKGRGRYFSERNLFASLIKNYGFPQLLVALPTSLGVSLLNSVLFALTGRREAAKQTLSALQWNLVHLPSTLRLRARSQRRRKVKDRDVMKLMVRGAPRVRSYVERALEQIVGEPAEGIEEEGDHVEVEERKPRGTGDFIKRHPGGIVIAIFAFLYLIGARTLYGSGGLSGADLAPFPLHPSDFFTEFFSGWRSAGTGGAAPASPGLFLAGLLSVVSFGSARLAERIFVLSLVPLAAASVATCARALGLPQRAKWAAVVTYALSPLALATFSQGRIPDLVIVAALPVLLLPALRAGGLAGPGDWRSLATGVVGLAAVASVAPYALPAIAGASVVIAIAARVAGHRDGAPRIAFTGLAQSVGATILLLPWSVELFKGGSGIGAGPSGYGVPLTRLVRAIPGGSIPFPGVLAWALPLAAAAGVALAIHERERLAKTLAVSATIALLLAWSVSRGVPWIAPRPALPLTLAALGAALLVALGAEGIVPALRARSFGVFHLGIGTVALAVGAAALLGVGFLARGHYDGLARSGELIPAFFSSEARAQGDFRLLWLSGSARDLRADLTGYGGESALTYATRRGGGGQRYLEDALASILTHETEQGGRLVAPLGVRYLILRPGFDRNVEKLLLRQVDIRFSQRFRGAEILMNEAWIPVGGAVSSARWSAASLASQADAAKAAASLPLDPGRAGFVHEERPGRLEGEASAVARTLLLASDYSDAWRADHRAGRVTGRRSFGWATSFPLTGAGGGPVLVSWAGQGWHRLAVLGEVAMFALIAAAWSRRAAIERGER
jgi:GT2 family glycosyltransferase